MVVGVVVAAPVVVGVGVVVVGCDIVVVGGGVVVLVGSAPANAGVSIVAAIRDRPIVPAVVVRTRCGDLVRRRCSRFTEIAPSVVGDAGGWFVFIETPRYRCRYTRLCECAAFVMKCVVVNGNPLICGGCRDLGVADGQGFSSMVTWIGSCRAAVAPWEGEPWVMVQV